MSGGEAVTQGIIDWVSETFDDAVLNQGYGQTEAAGLICTCEALIPTKEDKLGRPVPGQTVTLLDEDTYELIEQSGTPGEIAVQYTDSPLCYDEYWNKPEETSKARAGEWHLTGDIGLQDDEGYFEFVSRVDDVIISSGYRIGPEELEDVLGEREEIVQAGVIGVPHDERSEVPKAFVILTESAAADPPDKAQLKQYVKDELGKFKYPREIEYVDELPTTATGKIRRVDLRKREGIAANT
jgi:acetyl-CoA synthetase